MKNGLKPELISERYIVLDGLVSARTAVFLRSSDHRGLALDFLAQELKQRIGRAEIGVSGKVECVPVR